MATDFDFDDSGFQTTQDTQTLADMMADFTKTSGSVSLQLISSVDGVDPVHVTNVSLYEKGHDNYKQSHSALLDLKTAIDEQGIDFDLSKIKVVVGNGWSDLFEKPDVDKQAAQFFGIDDFSDVMDTVKQDSSESSKNILDSLNTIKEEQSDADDFKRNNKGYLNIYITFKGIDYKLKDLPMLRNSPWISLIRSYVLYMTVKNPGCTFKDLMGSFKLEVYDLRLSHDIDTTDVLSGF